MQKELEDFSELIPNSFQQRITQGIFNKIFFPSGQETEVTKGRSNFLKKQMSMKEALKADDLNMRSYLSGGESEDEDELSSHSQSISSHNESVLNRMRLNMHDFGEIENLGELVQKLTTKLCRPEDMLLNRGDMDDKIYFLSKGIIEIYLNDPRDGKIEDEYFELE